MCYSVPDTFCLLPKKQATGPQFGTVPMDRDKKRITTQQLEASGMLLGGTFSIEVRS
jgi:hypothetical protein